MSQLWCFRQCHNCGAFARRSLCHEDDYKNSAFLQRLRTSNVPATDQPLYTLSSPADFNAFDASGSIWQLSHVCQIWRNVALSLQSFWSTMDVYFPEAAQSKADVERLKAVIQRSRQGLLSVALNDDDKPQGPAAHARHRGLDILYASLPNRLPRLEAVRLYCIPPGLYEYEALKSVFKDCPRLTKLTLGQGTQDVVFPWDQITELELCPMDIKFDDDEEWVHLIGRCPSLEILFMPQWDFSDDEIGPPYTPITCSKLSKLDVMSVPVINALTLPSSTGHAGPSASHNDSLYHSFQIVPLADHTLHSILSQTHSLAFLNLTITIKKYDDQTDVSDRDQILMLVKSLEVMPTETITCLPLLSSMDIRIYNHRSPWSLE
ncbi:hypothetical protein CPB85DRAFT_1441115 [Mucidula mucida]|nr:hypothetical protein CPB85DRAFT_1441115 [Mucidula mucida]